MTITPAGVATFSLFGEFDHGGADSLALQLGAFVQATDFDGDTIKLPADLFVVNVEDGNDPLVITGSASGTVEEEHLDPSLSGAYAITATGNDDTTDTGGLDHDVNGDLNVTTHQTTGVLSSLLTITGNEGPLGFAFAGVSEGAAVQKAGGGDLTSGGETVQFHQIDATHIVGYVNEGGAGYTAGVDHVVFSLDITDPATGAYTFTLLDKVDHHPVDAADNAEGKSPSISAAWFRSPTRATPAIRQRSTVSRSP